MTKLSWICLAHMYNKAIQSTTITIDQWQYLFETCIRDHPGHWSIQSLATVLVRIKRTWPDWSRSSNHAAREQDENRNCDGKTQWSCCGSMLEGCENLWDLLVSQRKKRWNFGMPHLGCQSSRGSSWIIIGLECQVRSESEDVSFEVDVLCKEWASCMVTAALWLCKLVVTSC